MDLPVEPRPSFKKGHFSEHVAKLTAACEWLGIGRGRAARYGELTRELFEDNSRSREHILGVNESCEIVELFELWKDRVGNFPGLAERIRTVFNKGPLLQEDENPASSTNRARNDAFGYLVAGKLLAASVPVVAVDGIVAQSGNCLSEADITVQWSETLFDIECKRPQSHASLEQRTKEARDQIQRPSRGGRHGVIALDCSVLVRPAGTLLETDSGEDAERSISVELEKSIVPKVESHLTHLIPGFILFARVPAMTRIRQSPTSTNAENPAYDFRPDSISTLLLVSNAQYTGPDVIRRLAERLVGKGRL